MVPKHWKRDREVILTYLSGNSLYATAAAFGITAGRVHQIMQRYHVKTRTASMRDPRRKTRNPG